TNNERIDFAYSFCKRHNILDKEFLKKEKCNMKSLELRNKGNAMFGAKKDLDAIKLYTESIAYAENGSSHLGLAYANRSAVLFENRYYEECLKDISRALKNNYPQNLLKKIVGRQKRAESLRGVNKRSISYCDPPPDIPNRNPHIASASSCVELKRNSVFGTHIVTTRDVKGRSAFSGKSVCSRID
ncbi:hypothetical protein NQ317_007896, partial [Molorchus minor]